MAAGDADHGVTHSANWPFHQEKGGFRIDGSSAGIDQDLYSGGMPRQQGVRSPQAHASGWRLWRAQSMNIKPDLSSPSTSVQAFPRVHEPPFHTVDTQTGASAGLREDPERQRGAAPRHQRRGWRNSFAVALCLEPPARCIPLSCDDSVSTQVTPGGGRGRQVLVTKAQALRSIGEQLEVTRIRFEGAKGQSELPESLFSCSREHQQQGEQGQPLGATSSAASAVAAEVWMRAFEACDTGTPTVHHSVSQAHKAGTSPCALDSPAFKAELAPLWAGEEDTSESRVLGSEVSLDHETFESTQSSSSRVNAVDEWERERGVGDGVWASSCNALLMRDLLDLKMKRHPHAPPPNLTLLCHRPTQVSGSEGQRKQKQAKLKSLGDAAPFDLSVTGPIPQQAPQRAKKGRKPAAQGDEAQPQVTMTAVPLRRRRTQDPDFQEARGHSSGHRREQGLRQVETPGFQEPPCSEGKGGGYSKGPETECSQQPLYGFGPKHLAPLHIKAQCSVSGEAQDKGGGQSPETALQPASPAFSRRSPRRRDRDSSPARPWRAAGATQGGRTPNRSFHSGEGVRSSPLLDRQAHQSMPKWGADSVGSAGEVAFQSLCAARSMQEAVASDQLAACQEYAQQEQAKGGTIPMDDLLGGCRTDGDWQALASALKQAERVALENAHKCRERLKALQEQEARSKREGQHLTPRTPDPAKGDALQSLIPGRLDKSMPLASAAAEIRMDLGRPLKAPNIEGAVDMAGAVSLKHPSEDVGAALAGIQQRAGVRMERQRKGTSTGASKLANSGAAEADKPQSQGATSPPHTPKHSPRHSISSRGASQGNLFGHGRLGDHAPPQRAAVPQQGREGSEERPLLPHVATFEGWGHGSEGSSETPVADVLGRLIEEKNSMKALLSPRHTQPSILNLRSRGHSAESSSTCHTPRHGAEGSVSRLPFLSRHRSLASMGYPCMEDQEDRSCLLEGGATDSPFWDQVFEDRSLADDLSLPGVPICDEMGAKDSVHLDSRTEPEDVGSVASSQRRRGSPRGRASSQNMLKGHALGGGSPDGWLTPRTRTRVKSELKRRRGARVRAKLRELDNSSESVREDCLAGLVEGGRGRGAQFVGGDNTLSDRRRMLRGEGSRSSPGLPDGVPSSEALEALSGWGDSETSGDVDSSV